MFGSSKINLSGFELQLARGLNPRQQAEIVAARPRTIGMKAGGNTGMAMPKAEDKSANSGCYYAASPLDAFQVPGRYIPARYTPKAMLREACKPHERPSKKRSKLSHEPRLHSSVEGTGVPISFATELPHQHSSGRGGQPQSESPQQGCKDGGANSEASPKLQNMIDNAIADYFG